MASDDLVELEGTVTKEGGAGKFFVKPENMTKEILAHLCGKMREHRIRVVAGDRVTVAVSPYDLTKGRIVYRHKN